MTILSNVYIPINQTPYNLGLHPQGLILYAFAMVAELLTFYAIQKDTAPFLDVLVSLAIANGCSAIVGLGLAMLLPSLAMPRDMVVVAASWLLAFILSIGIEYPVLLVFPRWRTYKGLLRAVVLSNAVSYAVLAIPSTCWLFIAQLA